MAKTTVYLEVEPVWSQYRNANGTPRLNRIKVVRLVQKQPTRFAGVVVKLTVSIPDGAFLPLAPEVTIDVPESALSYTPIITVELPDAADEDEDDNGSTPD